MTIKYDQYEDGWVKTTKKPKDVRIVKLTELTDECIQKIAKAVADELERRSGRMTEHEKIYYNDRAEVRQFLREHRMSAWDLQKITKELCACGTCRFFFQHYTKDGDPLDWGHCCKGNIQHSKKISTASCGFWEDGVEE